MLLVSLLVVRKQRFKRKVIRNARISRTTPLTDVSHLPPSCTNIEKLVGGDKILAYTVSLDEQLHQLSIATEMIYVDRLAI